MKIRHTLLAITAVCAFAASANAQILLNPAGGTYTENFTGISTATPTGWSVSSNGTATSFGTLGTTLTSTTAGNVSGNFRSMTDAPGVLAVRQTGAFGEPGAGFYLQIADTTDLENFSFTLNAGNYNAQPRTTTYTVQYGLGASPSSWTTLGTISSDAAPANYTYSNITGIADVSGPVYIRVVALSGSTGTGNRDTFGINSASLTYTAVVPEPVTSAMLLGGAGMMVWSFRRKRVIA